jgi:glutaredoxin-like YruB-family protein
MNEHNVVIYSTPSCVYCRLSKNFFKQNGVKFKEIDVSANHAAAHEMIEKSGQMGVPVVDIDGEILVGFQPKVFARLLNLK